MIIGLLRIKNEPRWIARVVRSIQPRLWSLFAGCCVDHGRLPSSFRGDPSTPRSFARNKALRCQVGVADYVESRLGQFVNAKRPGSSYFLGTAFPAYSG
jgi:hypothetical protein